MKPILLNIEDISTRCQAAAERVMQRCDELATCSETSIGCTRTFCSPAMSAAHGKVRTWMAAAGLATRLDPATNLIGRTNGASADPSTSKVLLVGSHLDTVINAGRYDGPLGVLMGIELAEILYEGSVHLPFAMEVVGFCEEEGIRYATPFIGSRAIAGTLDSALFDRADTRGVPMRSAIESFRRDAPDCVDRIGYDPQEVIGYIEPHIEQGPVLEQEDLPVGIVEAIAGQTRAAVQFVGSAGHAGTVPMHLRRDALAAAAEWITQVEMAAKQVPGAVATVAQMQIAPNVSNVICSDARMRLDLRHRDDSIRGRLVSDLMTAAEAISKARALGFRIEWQEDFPAVQMDPTLSVLLNTALVDSGVRARMLVSGAGHDAGIIANSIPTAMLFVRCRGGISHHPDESVRAENVAVGLEVLLRLINKLAAQYTLK